MAYIHYALASQVYTLMKKEGLSVRELAARANVSAGTVRRALDGRNISVSSLRLLAKALSVKMGDLLTAPGRPDFEAYMFAVMSAAREDTESGGDSDKVRAAIAAARPEHPVWIKWAHIYLRP